MEMVENETEQRKKEAVKDVKDANAKFLKIEFDKYNLFFRSLPNEISFDRVKIKNNDTTCIYFKWQKFLKPFSLPDKKSDGIDRFFCHYSDSKIFPDEEKEFVFSFFSEKNGIFSEDWILTTSPPITNSPRIIHLNGMCHLLVDKYQKPIEKLDSMIFTEAVKTAVNEMVIDLLSTIKENEPPLPDMNDPKVFKFYFTRYNKEYNVVYSRRLMKRLLTMKDQIHNLLGTDMNDRYWNGSLDAMKLLIEKLPTEDVKADFLARFDLIIHNGRKCYHEDSLMFNYIRNLFCELSMDFNDIANPIREEMLLPPYMFDVFTRASLTEPELVKYKNELSKRKDEWFKKTKKKPYKNAEEEEKELADFKIKLKEKVAEKIGEKFWTIENDSLEYTIEEALLNSTPVNEEYIDRLCRVTNLKNLKNAGIVDSKFVVLRMDIEDFEKEYEQIIDDDNNVIGQEFKSVNFQINQAKDKERVLNSLEYLLNNTVKALLLLVDFGPKLGKYHPEYSTKKLIEYLEARNEYTIFFIENMTKLEEYLQKIRDDELKENSLLILENLNFFPEECGFETEVEPLINPEGQPKTLSLYRKNKFIEQLTLEAAVYVNDSFLSFDKMNPTIIDVKGLQIFDKNDPKMKDLKEPIKVLGNRIEESISKITQFFSINSKELLLIIGENECFNVSGRSALSETSTKCGKYLVDSQDEYTTLTNLLIINATMLRFKEIFIFGKLAIYFIQFLRKDFTLFDPKYKINPVFWKLMKYILVKAKMNNVKIILPTDFKILKKEEYEKYTQQLVDDAGFPRDYMKEIKTLLKRERIQKALEDTILDQDELNENPDYIKIKLEDSEKDLLKLYKERTREIKIRPFCFDFIEEFVECQKIEKPKKIFKTEIEIYRFNQSIYKKNIAWPKEVEVKTRNYNPIYDHNEYELVDYGEKSYAKLNDAINRMYCVMWLGKLSPSKVENLYDNYFKIIDTINKRKKFLRDRFEEDQTDPEKKLHETDLKAKKDLLNILLKSNTVYEVIKENYRMMLTKPQTSNPIEELAEEEEIPQDDEQFIHDMHKLIDDQLDDEMELINTVLKGKHIPGFYGLSADKPIQREEEFDPKILDDI